jgi:hypothetical protein
MQRIARRWALGSVLSLAMTVSLRTSSAAPPETIPPPQPVPAAAHWLGVHSCTARACHGHPGDDRAHPSIWGNELTVWSEHDKHARAYAALLEPQGIEIARKLGLPPAHEARECLVCHAPAIESVQASPGGQDFDPHLADTLLSEGVGCEACHGAAEKWLVPHTSATWNTLAQAAKERDYGLIDTKDLTRRAQLCAQCHVGTPDLDGDGLPDRDMNHDMIAAGHPRLTFEMASHHSRMPAHWTEKGANDRRHHGDFEARAWAIGQLVAAQAQLELLAARADAARTDHPRAVWPELSEFNCFACHHRLETPSWRQRQYLDLNHGIGRTAGMPQWGSWQFSLLSEMQETLSLAPASRERLQALQTTMARLDADPQLVSQQARAAATELGPWLTLLEQRRYDSTTIAQLQRIVADKGQTVAAEHWDGAAQVYLALAALEQCKLDSKRMVEPSDGEMRQSLVDLRGLLLFPPTVQPAARQLDSPQNFEPSVEVPARLRDIENLLLR